MKKMELRLQDHSVWYGKEIEEFSKNSIWQLLEDEKYTLTSIKNMVEKSLKTGEPFNIGLTFKSGVGKSNVWLIMQEYKG